MNTASIKYEELIKQDKAVNDISRKEYFAEIELFEQTCELIISLFDNSIRTYRKKDKIDYIKLIAVRIVQDCRSGLILGLMGLYPQSSSLIRGALESTFLIYDFKINPVHEDLWFNGSKTKRKKLFKTGEVKKRIEKVLGTELKTAISIYNLFSNWTIHSNMESFLWYIEMTDKMMYYHWAGRYKKNMADMMIFSCLMSLSHALFVLVHEDIYTFKNAKWMNSFLNWRKNNFIALKKFASIVGIHMYDCKMVPVKIVSAKREG